MELLNPRRQLFHEIINVVRGLICTCPWCFYQNRGGNKSGQHRKQICLKYQCGIFFMWFFIPNSLILSALNENICDDLNVYKMPIHQIAII